MSAPDAGGAPIFEVLDHRDTQLGELLLRRRSVLSRGGEIVWEVTLDGAFLMSSMVDDAERALTTLALDRWPGARDAAAVLVGGLGLGCTAHAALSDERVGRVVVAELLEPVIDWHRRGLVPLGAELCGDPRCELRAADFYAMIAAPPDPADPRWDAILVDIDHSPRALLSPGHGSFYDAAGLGALTAHLAPDGVFGLWSADPVDDEFVVALGAAFRRVDAERVAFDNPLLDRADDNVIYLASDPRG